MSGVFYQYMMAFLHPFQVQEQLRTMKITSPLISDTSLRGINIYEGIAISWLFYIVYSFYSLITLIIGLHAHNDFGNDLVRLLDLNLVQHSYTMVKTGIAIALFPLTSWIWVRLWGIIITSFARIFRIEDHSIDTISDEITRNALASNCLLIIPVFGGFASHVGSLIMIYAGLRRNLDMPVGQSIIVLLVPLIVILLLIFLMILSLSMLLMG